MKLNKFFIVLMLVLVSNVAFAESNPYVRLLITPPTKDGGNQLSLYRIEYMEVGTREWKLKDEIPVMMIENTVTGRFEYVKQYYDVRDLEEGKTYVFRVTAISIEGPGKPGPKSQEVIVGKESIGNIPVKSGEGA